MAIGGVAATPTSHARIGAGGISGLLADRWIGLTALLGLAWLIAYAAAKALIESERATLVLSDIVYLGPGAAATLACLVAARRARRRQRVFWRLLAASNLCIFSGAVVWATLELGLGRDSFPSLADVFYLCGYAAALAAALFGLGGGLSRRLW